MFSEDRKLRITCGSATNDVRGVWKKLFVKKLHN